MLWGFAFVAQRKGMESLHPFSFNALRFALGAIFVRIVLAKSFKGKWKLLWQPGLILFVAASLQQAGLVYTSSGAAGFITGLYVLFVPLIGLFRGQKLEKELTVALLFSIGGLYLLNSGQSIEASLGNFLVLISALFFALHVQVIDKYCKEYSAGLIAFSQFGIAALLSFASAVVLKLLGVTSKGEADVLSGIKIALWPILYGGIVSAGIAYTLQIKAQQKAKPAPSAIIMSLEGVFALIGGAVALGEPLGIRNVSGSILILLSTLIVSFRKIFIDRIRHLKLQ